MLPRLYNAVAECPGTHAAIFSQIKAGCEQDNGSVRLYVTVASEQPNAELRKKGK